VKNIVYLSRNPWNTMLALGMLGSFILFMVLSSMLLLRSQSSDYSAIQLPVLFYISTGMLVISSFTLWLTWYAFAKERFLAYRFWLSSTIIVGSVFLVLQLMGWQQLFASGIGWNNIAGAFLYVLSGLHAAHILGGMVWLLILYSDTLRQEDYVANFLYRLNPLIVIRMRLACWYWHFVDVLWLYLFWLMAG
jgi:cytochrome c oxidase subunit III